MSLPDSGVLVVLTLVLHTLLSDFCPHVYSRFNSISDITGLRKAFGKSSLFTNVVIAKLVHMTLPGWLTHATLPIDSVAWLVLLHSVHPLAHYGLLCLMLIQNLSYRDTRFSVILGAVQFALFYVASALIAADSLFGVPVSLWASRVLVFGAPLRVFGHAFEVSPPLLPDRRNTNFRDAKPYQLEVVQDPALWKLMQASAICLTGLISELQAGFPLRLLPVWTYYAASFVCEPAPSMPWKTVAAATRNVYERGYSGDPAFQPSVGEWARTPAQPWQMPTGWLRLFQAELVSLWAVTAVVALQLYQNALPLQQASGCFPPLNNSIAFVTLPLERDDVALVGRQLGLAVTALVLLQYSSVLFRRREDITLRGVVFVQQALCVGDAVLLLLPFSCTPFAELPAGAWALVRGVLLALRLVFLQTNAWEALALTTASSSPVSGKLE